MSLDYRKLERVAKGFANKSRVQILELLSKEPELTVSDISTKLKMGYMNTSDHVRKMAIAGLILKRSQGTNVRHKLTDRAKYILVFCKKLK